MLSDPFRALKSQGERLIVAGRLVLSVFSLLAILLDPSGPGKYANLAFALLAGYVVYATLLALLVWRLPKLPGHLPIITHVFDLIVFSLLIYFSERPANPSFACFVFSIMGATLRWQWRGTLWTAVAALVASIGLGLLAMQFRHEPGLRTASLHPPEPLSDRGRHSGGLLRDLPGAAAQPNLHAGGLAPPGSPA